MNLRNFLNIFILFTCSFILYSCLSINRNIKLNKDGSGSETLSIIFNKQFYEMMASMTSFMDSARKQGYLDSLYNDEIFISKTKSSYDSISGIKLIDISSQRNADSSNTILIKYDFDSVQKIGSSLNQINDDNENSLTTVTLNKVGNNLAFNYVYEQLTSDSSIMSDSLSEQMKKGLAMMFGDGYIKFDIDFPYEVISSNSTSINGNTLIWNFPLSEIITNTQMKLEAIMKEN